jgi:uncharacterized protein (TIGR02145 family)
MKRTITFIVACSIIFLLSAQNPNGIAYQTVIRNQAGQLLIDNPVALRFSILRSGVNGAVVYAENHLTQTNEFGLISLEIGNGQVITGDFQVIPWGEKDFFLKVEVDINITGNYTPTGTQQFVSVPYALNAKSLTLNSPTGLKYKVTVDDQGNLITTLVENQWECGDPLHDSRDGKNYATVLIGEKCWMAENLNIGTRINGQVQMSDNDTIEKYCINDEPDSCIVYGGLYQWGELLDYDTQGNKWGICPDGWHIPDEAEWCELFLLLDETVNCTSLGYTGIDAGGKMKETGLAHWIHPNEGATNSSGFTALPGGKREYDGGFSDEKQNGYFWSSSPFQSNSSWYYMLSYSRADRSRSYINRTWGFSARCMKDY